MGEIQRARITAAMAELVHECGPGGVTVAHVVTCAGVSRRTFYELFEDREDCFLAAFDRAVSRIGERVIPTFQASGKWSERIRGSLEALLAFLEEEPEMGYLCVVGALGGGPRALERRARVVGALVDAVNEGSLQTRTGVRSGRRTNRLVAEGTVGAVLTVIHTRLSEPGRDQLAARDPLPLTGLLHPLMSMIVLPYLGKAAAERELARPMPKTHRASRPAPGDPLRDLHMRLTYRTVRVLLAIAASPAGSNRQVGAAAGIADQGQISKLLSRLQTLGLIDNNGGDHAKGEPNAWVLTPKGHQVTRTIATPTSTV